MILVGMGGHALVVLDALRASGRRVVGYCDRVKKENIEAKKIAYLGPETEERGRAALALHPFVVSIGDNKIRESVGDFLLSLGFREAEPVVHPTATLGSDVVLGRGTQVQGGVFVNADSTIGRGVILNTACIIEHECRVEDFSHVAPGAVLAGNVYVGQGAFVGANAVVLQGVSIGEGATVGAGTVVLKDVPPGRTVVGNPGRLLPSS